MAIPRVIRKQSPCACIPLLRVLGCINTPASISAGTLVRPANPHTHACVCVLYTCRGRRAIIACVLLMYVNHSVATFLHACTGIVTGCLLVTIRAKILSLFLLPTPLLSISRVQPPLPSICQADARGGIPSSPAQYSKQVEKRHDLPAPTLRVCSCLFKSLCMHLLRLC